MRKIIIPAAGKAERFNGILKEFAPIDNEGTTALQNTIRTAVHKLKATHITVVTNAQKQYTHMDYIKAVILPEFPQISFYLKLYEGSRDLLDSIATGFTTAPHNTEGGLLLPDTIVDMDVVDKIPAGITFGTFRTTEPHRFSVIADNTIYTKSNMVTGEYKAWGVVLWTPLVGQDMALNHGTYTHYDEMFRNMMWKYGYGTFPIHSYYDIGSIEHYMRYIDDNSFITGDGQSSHY